MPSTTFTNLGLMQVDANAVFVPGNNAAAVLTPVGASKRTYTLL